MAALELALSHGFGIETDLRDRDGQLVISHDMAREGCITCASFFERYVESGQNSVLALNIKADGLAGELKALLERFSITNYYVFDMSVPDTIGYLKSDMNVLARHSNLEPEAPFEGERAGVWCDSFNETPASIDIALAEVRSGRVGILVSPELHGRPHQQAWDSWKQAYGELADDEKDLMMICTDLPDEAHANFRGTI